MRHEVVPHYFPTHILKHTSFHYKQLKLCFTRAFLNSDSFGLYQYNIPFNPHHNFKELWCNGRYKHPGSNRGFKKEQKKKIPLCKSRGSPIKRSSTRRAALGYKNISLNPYRYFGMQWHSLWKILSFLVGENVAVNTNGLS